MGNAIGNVFSWLVVIGCVAWALHGCSGHNSSSESRMTPTEIVSGFDDMGSQLQKLNERVDTLEHKVSSQESTIDCLRRNGGSGCY